MTEVKNIMNTFGKRILKELSDMEQALEKELNPEPEHEYVKSPEDIKPWQFYICKNGRVGKFYKQKYDSNYAFVDIKESLANIHFYISEIIEIFRVAKISEIPKECLIGKMVVAWEEVDKGSGLCESFEGVVVCVDKTDRDNPYSVYNRTEDGTNRGKNIKLIDHPVNYI